MVIGRYSVTRQLIFICILCTLLVLWRLHWHYKHDCDIRYHNYIFFAHIKQEQDSKEPGQSKFIYEKNKSFGHVTSQCLMNAVKEQKRDFVNFVTCTAWPLYQSTAADLFGRWECCYLKIILSPRISSPRDLRS